MQPKISDRFMKVGGRGTRTTLLSPGKAPGQTTITLGTMIEYPSQTACVISMRKIDPVTREEVPGTFSVWKGVKNEGAGVIEQLTHLIGDANITYEAGDSTEVMIDMSSPLWNELIDGLLAEHNADGTHKMTAGFVKAVADAIIPVGAVHIYEGSAAQLGVNFPFWLIAGNKGTKYKRVDYPRLYAHYQASHSSRILNENEFSLDEVLGRVFAVKDNTQTEFNTLGKNVGSKTHTLTIGEIPNHRHSTAAGGANTNFIQQAGGGKGSTTDTGWTSYVGEDKPHNNIQPTTTTSILVKY